MPIEKPQQNPFGDRITEILQQQSQQRAPQVSGQFLNDLSMAVGLGGQGANVVDIVNAIETPMREQQARRQQQQLMSAQNEYEQFERELARGNEQAVMINDKISKLTSDPELQAKIKQDLISDPEIINPKSSTFLNKAVASLRRHDGKTDYEIMQKDKDLERQQKQEEIKKLKREAQYGGSGSSYMEDAMIIMQKNPDMEFNQAYALARGGIGQGVYLDPETKEVKSFTGAPEARGELKKGETAGKEQAELEYIGPKEREKLKAKRIAEAPAAYNAAIYSTTNSERMAETAKELLNHPGLEEAVGFGEGALFMVPGSVISKFPGTKAADFASKLITLKSQVFVDAIQSMRAASETGGAVGQVNETELENFQNQYAALSQAQGDEQFKTELQKLIEVAETANKNIREAYMREYGSIEGAPQFNIGKESADLGGTDDKPDPLGVR